MSGRMCNSPGLLPYGPRGLTATSRGGTVRFCAGPPFRGGNLVDVLSDQRYCGSIPHAAEAYGAGYKCAYPMVVSMVKTPGCHDVETISEHRSKTAGPSPIVPFVGLTGVRLPGTAN